MNSELQSLFNQAVEAQSQSKEIEALALYKSINQKGFTSSALELNKALLFEKQEDWGHALSSLEKAQFLARSPWLANDKIARIQKQIGSNRAYSIGSLGELTGEISKIIRPSESFFFASIFIGVFLLVRAVGFFHKGFRLCVLLAILLSIFSSIAFFSDKTAYVISEAELKPLPLEESVGRFNVGRGAKVVVLREKGKFTEVERPGDFLGWIQNESLLKN